MSPLDSQIQELQARLTALRQQRAAQVLQARKRVRRPVTPEVRRAALTQLYADRAAWAQECAALRGSPAEYARFKQLLGLRAGATVQISAHNAALRKCP